MQSTYAPPSRGASTSSSRARDGYIFGYLVSFGIGRNASEGCQGEGDNQVLIDLLVRVVSHFTGQVVAPSETLRSELALHINAMLDRVRYGVRITNDYLEQFAGLHPRLLTLIEFACWALPWTSRIRVSV